MSIRQQTSQKNRALSYNFETNHRHLRPKGRWSESRHFDACETLGSPSFFYFACYAILIFEGSFLLKTRVLSQGCHKTLLRGAREPGEIKSLQVWLLSQEFHIRGWKHVINPLYPRRTLCDTWLQLNCTCCFGTGTHAAAAYSARCRKIRLRAAGANII